MLTQLSIFLDNQPGQLQKFTKVLLDAQINLRAISISETADYGILRILVDKPDDCIKILKEKNFLVSVTDVLAVEIPDTPGALHEIATLLGEEGINIEYLYSTILKDEAIIILRIDDIASAKTALEKKGAKLIDQSEF